MTQKEKQTLLYFRQWLITMTEKCHNKSKESTNSPCGSHYERGKADGCDANCNTCGMNRVCTASGYNITNYYRKWQQAENK